MLDHFPSLSTLIKAQRAELTAAQNGSKAVSILTGDFLMPYLLSTIDKGRGMMKTINHVPIDYVTFGNHENDLPHQDFLEREREFEGLWINSNMQSHESFKGSKSQVATSTIEVQSADGSNVRRVGLLSALTDHPSLYKPGAFGGAKILDPWDTMGHYKALLEQQGVDFVLPLCHLYEPEDNVTAQRFDFPVILSGHDHHRVDRVANGSRLLQPGQDAIFCGGARHLLGKAF
jgi:5''-nucleotidase/2'',3''-cyclic phosphodiesterase and related esterases